MGRQSALKPLAASRVVSYYPRRCNATQGNSKRVDEACKMVGYWLLYAKRGHAWQVNRVPGWSYAKRASAFGAMIVLIRLFVEISSGK